MDVFSPCDTTRRRSAIRRSAVGEKSRVQSPMGENAESRSRSRRGSVSRGVSPSAVVFNMSPRRPSDACSESSEESPVISRCCSSDEEAESSGLWTPASVGVDESLERMDVEDGMFLSCLLGMHADGLEGFDAMSEFDSLFSSSECTSATREEDCLLSEEELLSLLA